MIDKESMNRPNQRLNELTCLALGKVAHIEDSLEVIEIGAVELLQSIRIAKTLPIVD